MPRKRLPPRLYLRTDSQGRAAYVIRDGSKYIRTGLGPGDEREAQAALGQYLVARLEVPAGPRSADGLTVGEVLAHYATEHAPTTADPARIGYAIDALAPFWGDLKVSAVTGNTCRRYVRARGVGLGTVRRELGCLRAALRHCEREGYLIAAPAVWMPEKPASKEHWLTRSEAARLLWAARRTPHLARLILIGLYTGTRPGAILKLQWMPNTTGGYVDLERGLLIRGAGRGNKRQGTARIPRRLLAHLRRWSSHERLTSRGRPANFVVHWNGAPVRKLRTSWSRAAKRAGLDVTPHVLRHTCATWLMQRGVNLSDAAGFLGMSRETLERVYWHHSPDYQASAVKAMEGR